MAVEQRRMTKLGRLVNRRTVLAGIGAASVLPVRGLAAPPHRLKLGDFELTVLSDGYLTVPTRSLARNATDTEISASIGASSPFVTPPCNITLVRTPSETILIDVGAGPHFMTGAGQLVDNMQAAGIDRNAITKVVFTHAHPDHLWGVLDDFDDTPMFPKASYLIAAAELDFWLDQDAISGLPDDRKNFGPGAKRNLERIKDKLQTIVPGQDIVPGMRALDTAGHTVGHISVELAIGQETMVVLGDALTHATISFAYPEWMPAADHHDPARAVAMRKSLLDSLRPAVNRSSVSTFPSPGLDLSSARLRHTASYPHSAAHQSSRSQHLR
jgi:glyoxylase-like metal-dependent hydrolase (beta-lactamase superfamily II)